MSATERTLTGRSSQFSDAGAGYGPDTVSCTPTLDDTQTFGTALKRIQNIVSRAYRVYKSAGDANPSVEVADAYLKLGGGGAGALDWALQRASAGVALIPTGSKLQQTDAPTVGADLVNKTYADGLSVTAGDGLTKSGSTLNVGAGDGIQADPDSITVKLDGSTLSKSASGLKVSASAQSPVQLVEQKILVGDATDVTFNTGIAGDTDLTYELNIQAPLIANNTNWILRFNGDSVTGDYFYQQISAVNISVAASPNTPSGPGYFMTQDAGSSQVVSCSLKIFAKSGKERSWLCLQMQGGMRIRYWAGKWTNTVDPITSITIHSDVAGEIKSGTILTLYKWPNG